MLKHHRKTEEVVHSKAIYEMHSSEFGKVSTGSNQTQVIHR